MQIGESGAVADPQSGGVIGLAIRAKIGSSATGLRRLLAVAGLFAAGMASKEGAIVLIPLMLLFDLAFRAERLPQWKTPAAFYPAAAAGLAIELYLRHIVRVKARAPEHPFLDNPLFGAGFLEGRLTACGVLLRYLKLLLWPSTLSADYSYNQIPLVSMGAGLAALAARTVRRGRGKRTAYIGARRPALRGRVRGPALLARSLTYGSG